ncbi:hypothetical protein [Microvirga sp. Mcv34]|uniref:hypothetical protein n=1 Tax=Microvirga sp. Mcv34 TaxID=2926016 RepID=UPI0021C5DB01|nr:hypothetical protein [Microvirga sp. Mcv34]
MLQELLAAVVSVLIVDPLQAEMNERLSQIRAPQAVITDMRSCAEASLPRLADRAVADPFWAVRATFDVWTGRTAPEDILGGTSTQCDAAIKAARLYLESRGA